MRVVVIYNGGRQGLPFTINLDVNLGTDTFIRGVVSELIEWKAETFSCRSKQSFRGIVEHLHTGTGNINSCYIDILGTSVAAFVSSYQLEFPSTSSRKVCGEVQFKGEVLHVTGRCFVDGFSPDGKPAFTVYEFQFLNQVVRGFDTVRGHGTNGGKGS